jgi:hypothetical protein
MRSGRGRGLSSNQRGAMSRPMAGAALSVTPMVHNTRYSAGMTLTRLVLLVMAVMVVLIVARTMFGSRR